MASAGLIATQMTDHSSRTWILTIDGLDVFARGTGGGVPVESVSVTEAGPGQVSSMTFTVEDPAKTFAVAGGEFVRFHDCVHDVPLFAGWIQSWSPRAVGLGRSIDVVCVGIEAILDWLYVPSVTYPRNTILNEHTQQDIVMGVVAQAVGMGHTMLRAAGNPALTNTSTLAYPTSVSQYFSAGEVGGVAYPPNPSGPVTFGDCPLRQAIQQILDWATMLSPNNLIAWTCTVDFRGNLRILCAFVSSGPLWSNVADYAPLAVSSAGPVYPTGLEYTMDAGGAIHWAQVDGTGVSGLYSDGSGLPGPVGAYSDATLTQAHQLRPAALAYLGAKGIGIRGSVRVDDLLDAGATGSERRAGTYVTLTDSSVGIAGVLANITQIAKQFLPGGKENWQITFGAERPSFANSVRRLTRATLS